MFLVTQYVKMASYQCIAYRLNDWSWIAKPHCYVRPLKVQYSRRLP